MKAIWTKVSSYVWVLVLIIVVVLIGYGGCKGCKYTADWVKNFPSATVDRVRVVQAHGNPEATPSQSSSSSHQIPVRSCSRSARWDGDRKVWSDASGEFITPPNLFVWRTDLGCWHAPFSEFAELYPEQVDSIVRLTSGWKPEYLNEKNIVRKYGKTASPPRY